MVPLGGRHLRYTVHAAITAPYRGTGPERLACSLCGLGAGDVMDVAAYVVDDDAGDDIDERSLQTAE